MRIGLLFGGNSGEHEVSIASARAVVTALRQGPNRQLYDLVPIYIQKDGTWLGGSAAIEVLSTGLPLVCTARTWVFPPEVAEVDLWFPVLHGPNGEDGTIQGLLQLMGQPFVGCRLLASALAMDKIVMKRIFAQAGLPQVQFLGLEKPSAAQDPQVWLEVESILGYPCFVKPANLGSSVGITKVRNRNQLVTALAQAAALDRRLIVEAGVIAREVECAVLGNDQPRASVVGEITYTSDFYDYQTKYTPGQADLLIPAPLPLEVSEQVQSMALRAFQAIGGAGLARVDFFYQADGTLLVNEINTLPGFTATSMYPALWTASGLTFPDLVHELITLAQPGP